MLIVRQSLIYLHDVRIRVAGIYIGRPFTEHTADRVRVSDIAGCKPSMPAGFARDPD
jgi:hypothetical protein